MEKPVKLNFLGKGYDGDSFGALLIEIPLPLEGMNHVALLLFANKPGSCARVDVLPGMLIIAVQQSAAAEVVLPGVESVAVEAIISGLTTAQTVHVTA